MPEYAHLHRARNVLPSPVDAVDVVLLHGHVVYPTLTCAGLALGYERAVLDRRGVTQAALRSWASHTDFSSFDYRASRHRGVLFLRLLLSFCKLTSRWMFEWTIAEKTYSKEPLAIDARDLLASLRYVIRTAFPLCVS